MIKVKALVKASVILTVIINEDAQGNQNIEGIGDIKDILDFKVIETKWRVKL